MVVVLFWMFTVLVWNYSWSQYSQNVTLCSDVSVYQWLLCTLTQTRRRCFNKDEGKGQNEREINYNLQAASRGSNPGPLACQAEAHPWLATGLRYTSFAPIMIYSDVTYDATWIKSCWFHFTNSYKENEKGVVFIFR